MKALELSKAFDHKEFEDRIYSMWKESGYFAPNGDSEKDPFVIVIPPPNVTGVLHMGHGLNNTLQDVLIRYYRMKGNPTLWVPGTDHAGIATQAVVEKKLRVEGTSRHELGREKFVERTWKVKEEHHAVITRQLEKIGASCDWSRERFTMDEGLSKAVTHVFVELYKRDLIYKGEYLVNWCPSCGTALSDDEVEHKEVHGRIWRYRYPLVDGSGSIEVATTRPETMLGDTAVAVHPEDERYENLVGREVELPLTGRTIPIVADSYVDREFGSGAVKVTPAHDQNDWEIGVRHDLERINILNPDGTLNENVPERYRGMTARAARATVVEDIKAAGLFVGEEEHTHQIGHCYRCDTVIEPYKSKQWFVRMKPLAEKALETWRKGEIVFYPRKWENTYTHWLNNIRDWCISRQLWWGHRIPAWYDDASGEVIVSESDPTEDPKYAGRELRQDPDVLDTWFSSWLWPFSTLGWPEETQDLKTYYPTTALVTGYDIIFFWVSRMIMAGLEFTGKAPFRDIYITSLVRDKQGRKMSKSLGNGIDPLDIVEEYGADAHRFTLSFMASQGQDILIDSNSFQFGSKFANKIWNASRYLLMNLDGRSLIPFEEIELEPVDRWLYHRLNETVRGVEEAFRNYRFDDASSRVYDFFWSDFCDWYIEASKLHLYAEDDREKDRAASLLVYALEETLRLLHPFVSFVTEEIYQKLPDITPADGSERAEAAIIGRYPQVNPHREAPKEAVAFAALQEAVRAVRTLRSEFTIPPSMRLTFHVRFDEGFAHGEFFRGSEELLKLLTGSEIVSFGTDAPEQGGSIPVVASGFEVYVFIKEVIDTAEEVKRLEKSIEKAEKQLAGTQKKLGNPNFVDKAKPEAVEREREKERELTTRLEKMRGFLQELKAE
ncbi:MAG: valine--tRNA ligase [Spirochaetaceae bacterium]